MTTRITKLSSVMLVSAVLVLSSIAAVQLLSTNNNNAAFAVGRDDPCKETVTGGILEIVCSGGVGGGSDPDFPVGGSGGHLTCTIDQSTEDATCTEVGGSGSSSFGDFSGGGGGMRTCTGTIGEDDNCVWSEVVGGGRPPSDDGGGGDDPGEGDG